MERGSFLFLFIAATVLFCVTTPGAYSETDSSFIAKVDKTQLRLNETVVLSIILSGEFKVEPKIVLPRLKDFKVIASSSAQNISISNGEPKVSIEFQYILKPKKAGKLIIDSCKIFIKNKTFTSTPIEVEVLQEPWAGDEAKPQEQDKSDGAIL